MALPVKISARATAQIEKADAWWADNRPAAPGAVRNDLAEALMLLARQPGVGHPYDGGRVKGIRHLLLGRIRYVVYYRATPDVLEVLAFWHMSRGRQPMM